MKTNIENMDLVLFNVKKELNDKNYNASKTLMNTYRTLLKRFLYLNSSDKRIDEHRIMLDSHKEQLMLLHNLVEKIVGAAINNGEYKNADTLVEVSWRLEKSSDGINDLIRTREKFVKNYNRDLRFNDRREIEKAAFTDKYTSDGRPIYEPK